MLISRAATLDPQGTALSSACPCRKRGCCLPRSRTAEKLMGCLVVSRQPCWRDAVLVVERAARTSSEQELDHRVAPSRVEDGPPERGVAMRVHGIDPRAPVEQLGRDLDPIILRREVQRSPTLAVLGVDVRSLIQKD